MCPGSPDERYVKMCEEKGKLASTKGELTAYLDDKCSVVSAGKTLLKTVHHVNCELLIRGSRCQVCSLYRDTLCSMYANFTKQNAPSASANHRYLTTLQKVQHIKSLKQARKNKQRQLQRLQKKLDDLTVTHGVVVDQALGSVLHHSRKDIDQLQHNDFKRVFWEQQVKLWLHTLTLVCVRMRVNNGSWVEYSQFMIDHEYSEN